MESALGFACVACVCTWTKKMLVFALGQKPACVLHVQSACVSAVGPKKCLCASTWTNGLLIGDDEWFLKPNGMAK